MGGKRKQKRGKRMKLLASSSARPPHNSDLRKESSSVPYTETNYALDQNLQTINGLWQLRVKKVTGVQANTFLNIFK